MSGSATLNILPIITQYVYVTVLQKKTTLLRHQKLTPSVLLRSEKRTAHPSYSMWPGYQIPITLMRIRIQLFSLMRIRIQLFTSMRIRILLLNKVMRICNHCPTGPPGLHFEPPRLHFERPRLHFEPRKPQIFLLKSGSSFLLHCGSGSCPYQGNTSL